MCTFIIFFYKSPFQYISFTSIIILGIIKFYLKEMTTIAIKKIINNYDCTAVHSMLMQKISNGTKIGLKLLIYKMIHLVNLVIPFTVGSEAIQVYNRTVLAFFSNVTTRLAYYKLWCWRCHFHYQRHYHYLLFKNLLLCNLLHYASPFCREDNKVVRCCIVVLTGEAMVSLGILLLEFIPKKHNCHSQKNHIQ